MVADRLTRRQAIIPFQMASIGCMSTLAFVDSQEAFFAAIMLSGICSASVQPAVQSFAADVTTPENRGKAGAISQSCRDYRSVPGLSFCRCTPLPL